MNPYETLKVDRNSNDATIKSSYRTLAQQTHPDKSNGDGKEFYAVQAAYDVLSDPARRDLYDETGSIEEAPKNVAQTRLISILDAFITNGDFTGDIVKVIGDSMRGTVTSLNQQMSANKTQIVKLTDQLNRITTEGFNLYDQILTSKIDAMKEKQKLMIVETETWSEALEMLEGYEDSKPPEIIVPDFNQRGALGGLGSYQQSVFNNPFNR